MAHRHNWEALKLEFLQGPWETVSAFRKFKGWPPYDKDNYLSVKTKGWGEEKREIMAEAARRAAGNIVESKADEIRRVRDRQAQLARLMQLKGATGLKTLDPKTSEEARRLLLSGLQEERSALGISEKGGVPSSLTQVNVNLPKTKFDEILAGKDFEGVLKLIADIRRERTRRIGRNVVSQGEVEVE